MWRAEGWLSLLKEKASRAEAFFYAHGLKKVMSKCELAVRRVDVTRHFI
jgi:hypothetical protein